MAGINGLTLGFRSGANVRVNKFAAMIKSTTGGSITSQTQMFAIVGSATNAPGFLGVLVDHFVEPNFFVAQGTVSTTVTGTTPVLYNLTGKGMTLQVNGVARGICASAVTQGDLLIIADASGRLQTNSIAVGTQANIVGIAQNTTGAAEDIVQFLIQPFALT
jgi:hypothetical protein